jgi:hypothetical protein
MNHFVVIKVKKVKLSLCLIKHYPMNTYGGVDIPTGPPFLDLGTSCR